MSATTSRDGSGEERPVVAVWRSSWLPHSETFVANQVGALRGWRPFLVGLERTESPLVEPDFAPYGPAGIPLLRRRLNARTGMRLSYPGQMRQRQVRLIHAHFGLDGVQVLPLARHCRLPLVVTFHGFDATTLPATQGRAGDWYRARLPGLFSYASRLVAVSDFIAARLVELGAPAEKVSVEHIGIPTATSGAHRAPRDGLVFVGRLVDVKGVSDAITAVSLLPPRWRDVRFTVVGDGPQMSRLRSHAEARGVEVDFLGRRPSAQVADILDSHEVFVGPSRTASNGAAEGFGIVYLEAALHGLPVAAYRHGGVAEAVQHGVTGLLAAEGDVEALAANIDALLSDRALAARMGRAGQERVVQDFDVVRRTRRLEQLYAEVSGVQMRGHGPGSG